MRLSAAERHFAQMQTADTNARTQSTAHDTLLRMAGIRQLNFSNQMPLVLKPMKNQAAWRPVLGRLKLLAALIPLMGIQNAKGTGANEGVPGEPLMKFVGAAFGSANADVRATALSVALQVKFVLMSCLLRFYLSAGGAQSLSCMSIPIQ